MIMMMIGDNPNNCPPCKFFHRPMFHQIPHPTWLFSVKFLFPLKLINIHSYHQYRHDYLPRRDWKLQITSCHVPCYLNLTSVVLAVVFVKIVQLPPLSLIVITGLKIRHIMDEFVEKFQISLDNTPFCCKTNTNIRDLPGQLENLSFSSFSPGCHCGLAQESRGLGMCWQANTIVIITMVIDNLDAIAAFLKSIPTPTAFSISS